MKITWLTTFSLTVLFVGILVFPTRADALGPVDIEIGALAGTATGTLGPLGFGIGGRGGVSIGGLYAGVDVIDYLGATSTCGGCSEPPGVPELQQSQSALLYGLEAGYNLKISPITIRPQLGLGGARLSSSDGNPPPRPGTIANYFYLEPGVAWLVTLGRVFVGVDVAALVLAAGGGGGGIAVTAHGEIGVTF
jgi:hypothetical protein